MGPHGFLHAFLQHLGGLHGVGRQTIILHLDGRQNGPIGPHGLPHGEPHGRLGGGVHSSISSFLASGAPFILRITNSNTPRRGLVIVETLTGACSSAPEAATIHRGPWQGCIPCTGHGSLGPILICDTVATMSPLVSPGVDGHGFVSLIETSFALLLPLEVLLVCAAVVLFGD